MSRMEDYVKQAEARRKIIEAAQPTIQEGIKAGFLISDEELTRLRDYLGVLIRRMYNLKGGVTPIALVREYFSAEEKVEQLDLFCQILEIDRAELQKELDEIGGTIEPLTVLSPTEEDFNNRQRWMYEEGATFEGRPNVIFLITEMWNVGPPAEGDKLDQWDQDLYDGKITPSQHPRKQEILAVMCCCLDTRTHLDAYPIDRTPEKKMVIGPRQPQPKDFHFESPLLSRFWEGYATKLIQRHKPKD